jgi:hypothetical protein
MEKKSRNLTCAGRLGKTLISCLIAGQAFIGFPLLGGSEMQAAAAQADVVSTWMWNPYLIKDTNNTLQQLADESVNRVYLFIDPDYPAVYYSGFIKSANARGIAVHALSGAPNWVLPEHNKKMYEFIYWVQQYNKSVQPQERFSGIHLDVEPYVLAQWRQDTDAVIGLWMDTVSGFVEQVKADSELDVGIDMPVWVDAFEVRDGHGGRTTLSDWLIRKVDQVTLMAYMDNAQNITDSVRQEMVEADRAQVPVLIAVETADSGEAGGSFHNKGKTLMKSELNSVLGTMSTHPAFKGYSVHDWDNWKKLAP